MRSLMLLYTIAGAMTMSAQDFHGIAIGGTLSYPTIINRSGKALLGFAFLRHTDNGIDAPGVSLDIGRMINDRLRKPGTEDSMFGLNNGVRFAAVKEDGTEVLEGATTSIELTGLLFADGTFYGTDWAHANMAIDYTKMRSVARDLQLAEDKYTLMESVRARTRNASFGDADMVRARVVMSRELLDIRAEHGEPEADRALARLAALPDLVKGE